MSCKKQSFAFGVLVRSGWDWLTLPDANALQERVRGTVAVCQTQQERRVLMKESHRVIWQHHDYATLKAFFVLRCPLPEEMQADTCQ